MTASERRRELEELAATPGGIRAIVSLFDPDLCYPPVAAIPGVFIRGMIDDILQREYPEGGQGD